MAHIFWKNRLYISCAQNKKNSSCILTPLPSRKMPRGSDGKVLQNSCTFFVRFLHVWYFPRSTACIEVVEVSRIFLLSFLFVFSSLNLVFLIVSSPDHLPLVSCLSGNNRRFFQNFGDMPSLSSSYLYIRGWLQPSAPVYTDWNDITFNIYSI